MSLRDLGQILSKNCCFENCSDLLWEKKILVIKKNFCKFEADGREFAKTFDVMYYNN